MLAMQATVMSTALALRIFCLPWTEGSRCLSKLAVVVFKYFLE